MKIFFAIVLGFAFGASALTKSEWPQYNYLGDCTGSAEEEDSPKVTMSFYSLELDEKSAVNGFATVSASSGTRLENLGAYGATYKYGKNQDSVIVTVLGDQETPIEIPFGKDKKVSDDDGNVMICNLEEK